MPTAGFGSSPTADEALRILATTEVQQGARMQSLGLNFILNDETCAAFYRHLVRDGVASGYAVVSALTVGEDIVATLLGIRTGSRYVMIRISNAGGEWSNCSPGRLIIERTMAALHQDGVREFDFTIGNYAYKRRFGVTPHAARRSQRRPELARSAVCAARPRGAAAAPPSRLDRRSETRPRQAAVARGELSPAQARSRSADQTCRTTPGWPSPHSSASRSHVAAMAAAS